MDVRCHVCGWVLPAEEQAYAVMFKLKGKEDAFIYQHWGCWVAHGRFLHYDIDYDYLIFEMNKRAHPQQKK